MPGAYCNNSILIGNWSEERLKKEYELKIFLRKRDRKELLLQRSRMLFNNLLKEKPMEICGMYVLFGYNVQIVASDIPGDRYDSIELNIPEKHQKQNVITHESSPFGNSKPQYGLALSTLVSEGQVDYLQNISDGCVMTLSPIQTPCCRNTFVICSTEDESIHGEKVRYNEDFLLRAVNYGDPEASPLYVRYEQEYIPSAPDRLPVRLSADRDTNCRWTVVPLLPKNRLEGRGSPIKTGERLLVKSCVADKYLCVMNQSWMQTFFGPDEIRKWFPFIFQECGVTCRTYVDIHKIPTAENIFKLASDIEEKTKD